MVKTWNVTIPELTGNAKRRAYIYLPRSYKREPARRYPVLYMFDGHNVFFDSHATYGKSWGMKDYMDRTKTQLIIVAVECNHSPDNGRLKEYSPYTFQDSHFGLVEGKGDITMKWMVNYLKPMIDKNYRTLPDREHTFISGSSMGGLMSLYALLRYNHIFSRAAALSPSIWVAVDKLDRLVRSAYLDPNTVLYMDYGSDEFDNHTNMIHQYARLTSTMLKRGIYLDNRIVPKGTHCEASWERQIPIFMNTLLYEY